MTRKKILAICGSTRNNSTNHRLIKAIGQRFADRVDIVPFNEIGTIPVFYPGIPPEEHPPQVLAFRQQIKNADAVLICTPEYAHGVPGALKNAIDWTVSSGEFSQKITALITASTDGRFGHAALLETLKVIECKNISELHLIISFIQTRLNTEDDFTDEKTGNDVEALMNALLQSINSG
jgi:chromate reductase, NAD(P)H dehydrogenase (quinone)